MNDEAMEVYLPNLIKDFKLDRYNVSIYWDDTLRKKGRAGELRQSSEFVYIICLASELAYQPKELFCYQVLVHELVHLKLRSYLDSNDPLEKVKLIKDLRYMIIDCKNIRGAKKATGFIEGWQDILGLSGYSISLGFSTKIKEDFKVEELGDWHTKITLAAEFNKKKTGLALIELAVVESLLTLLFYKIDPTTIEDNQEEMIVNIITQIVNRKRCSFVY